MAMLLVPYNNAMRLGQGFNSFTHEICMDNAVVGMSDGEDTQPILPVGYAPESAPTDGSGNNVISDTDKTPLEQLLANMQVTGKGAQSQIVTYSSKYVEKISDITNDLNVSGSLSIRYGEISGGGSGSYVNTDAFQSSDVNFLITVKVVNQTINTKDQLMFWPLSKKDGKDVPGSNPATMNGGQFTKIYGDCFISGFQEGGMFTALVSMKALDSSKKLDIKANAHIALQVGVGEVKADANVEMAKSDLNKSSEIDITVNWSGGGQLKEGSERWTVDTLQEVAVRFQDLVAACPQRTHAILTKYEALRTYLQWVGENQLQPLDYEIASLYTSELLDVYMGYKALWKDIHVMMQGVDRGILELVKALPPTSDILMPKTRDTKIIDKDEHGNPLNPPKTVQTWVDGTKLNCFEPTYAGLDDAIQTCRTLMVRIVRENDLITANPELAVDSTRPVAYLRPQIFRTLLPTPAPDPYLSFKLQSKVVSVSDDRLFTWGFDQYYFVAPQVVSGYTMLYCTRDAPVIVDTSNVPAGIFPSLARVYLSPDLTPSQDGPMPPLARDLGSVVSLLAIPANNEGLQAGRWEMKPVVGATAPSTPPKQVVYRETVKFPVAYDDAPWVVVFISGFFTQSFGLTNISVKTDAITADGFDVVVRGNEALNWVHVSWIACTTHVQGFKCGSTETPWSPGLSNQLLLNAVPQPGPATGLVSFLPVNTFKGTPLVLAWISGFCTVNDGSLYASLQLADINRRSFGWMVAANLLGASISWIAIGQ